MAAAALGTIQISSQSKLQINLVHQHSTLRQDKLRYDTGLFCVPSFTALTLFLFNKSTDVTYSPPSPTGATYSPVSPLELPYVDNISTAFSDRPIRPLPKRRLRSRIPSDVANSILYSTGVSSSKPLFNIPYNEPTSYANGVVQQNSSSTDRQAGVEAKKASYQFRGNDIGSDDEREIAGPRQRQRPGTGTNPSSRAGYPFSRYETSKVVKPSITQSTASSNDSVDGYDSFENTNNKKKRKIPISGSLGNHPSSLSAEMAHMGISSTRDIDVAPAEADGGVGHYYGTGSSAVPAVSSGNGISGAGRGRYGKGGTRHHSGRSPLGVSFNGSNALQGGGSVYRRHYASNGNVDVKEAASGQPPDHGIISAAIANAAALPSTPLRGKENMSLLDQPSKKYGSAKTQFTFTCESDSAKSMVWPAASPTPSTSLYDEAARGPRYRASQANKDFATQGTQTSPKMAGQPGQPASRQPGAKQQAPQQPRKARRPIVKQYAIAARKRRIRQEYSNYHHPPKEEDLWICEFCEYESIFGEPPRALIQQYEAKDRRERKRLAEKQRLLEKAKMKGRKGKKGNKNVAKQTNAAAQPQQPTQKQRYDHHQPVDPAPMQHQGTQSDEYIPDDYDEEPTFTPGPPPQAPSKTQPLAQTRNQSLRSSPSNGTSGTASDALKAYF